MDQLMLLKPTKDYAEQIFNYRQTFIMQGDALDGTGSLYRMPDPEEWLQQVEDLSKPETTPENWDVTSQYICVRPFDNALVGMILVRHTLNDYLQLCGGHVEYSVLPQERKKGYGTWMLKNVLPYCREFGIEKVLLACEPQNEGGRKVICNNGGVSLGRVFDPEYEIEMERFVIDLSKA